MARDYVNQFSEFPYYIAGFCRNKEPFRIPLEETWEIFQDYLFLTKIKTNLSIHSVVLLPNQFRMLVSPKTVPVGVTMRDFLKDVSKELNFQSNRINQNWGTKYLKCEIPSSHHFFNVYKYIYQEPVRLGLAARCEQWPYSTLAATCGLTRSVIPLEEDKILFSPNELNSALDWLNQIVGEEDHAHIECALTKREFKLPKRSKRLNHLEVDLI